MANYPAPRKIAAGHVLITGFGERAPRSEFAIVETIAKATAFKFGRHIEFRFEWSSPGWECAGAAMRWTNGFWAVRWTDRNGSIQGQRFTNDAEGEAKARECFARYCAPEA